MAALSIKDVVDRVQARIAAQLGSATPPWRKARAHPLMLGSEVDQDTRQVAHLAYAAWSPSTDVAELRDRGRERLTDGAHCRSTVEVKFLHRNRADSMSDDADAAYTAEDTLRVAIMGLSYTDLHLTWTGSRREVLGDGLLSLHTLSFDADHRVALQ